MDPPIRLLISHPDGEQAPIERATLPNLGITLYQMMAPPIRYTHIIRKGNSVIDTLLGCRVSVRVTLLHLSTPFHTTSLRMEGHPALERAVLFLSLGMPRDKIASDKC